MVLGLSEGQIGARSRCGKMSVLVLEHCRQNSAAAPVRFLGVYRRAQHGLGGDLEQQLLDGALILVVDANLQGHTKSAMELGTGRQFDFPYLHPCECCGP